MCITAEFENKHALVRILSLVWMFNDIKHVAIGNLKCHQLKSDSACCLKQLVFLGVPADRLHPYKCSTMCAYCQQM
ncbi:MAG: hypothetical protein A2506_07345 [Elusimicrobia bacterium RIFOXYD12_FULL_66_9]|nr:MAG: hypothetical protein A2506_07345 [Elusimicrobia bacterium RIFOXYD12_FULL_66_9]